MNEPSPPLETSEFSPVLGGPLYQLYLRLRLARPPLELVGRRVVFFASLTWLPLLLLSAIERRLVGAGVEIQFLHDIEAHVRFLVALPILIAVEPVVNQRVRRAVGQFIDRGIVVPDEVPVFNKAIESALRLRNSAAIEVLLLVLVYTAGHWIWSAQIALQRATWYAYPGDSGLHLTLAGYWYAFASVPIFQFILTRWIVRLLIWFWLLWRISRLNLRLTPTHPDRAGGIGFVGRSAYAFGGILFAQGALLSGLIANRVFHEGQKLVAFKMNAAGPIVVLLLFFLGPLTVFTPHLMRAKRQGLRAYGRLANRYVQEFDEKWIGGGAPPGEPLVGSGDIQSLADLANSYAVVRAMRLVPFGWETLAQLALMTAAPLTPLVLTVVPLEDLAMGLLKILL